MLFFLIPLLERLKGARAGNMWRMLCKSQQGKDFKVTFSGIKADDQNGSAHWEARYDFSKTGRSVHNIIEAQFRFKDGLIIEHQDDFDLYRWSKQRWGRWGS